MDIEIGIEWELDNHENIVCLISSAGRCVIMITAAGSWREGRESDLSQSGETREGDTVAARPWLLCFK